MDEKSITAPDESQDRTSEVLRGDELDTDMIGIVEAVIGRVSVMRADGSAQVLRLGDFLYQGDKIMTGDDGSIGVRFADRSIFALDEDSEIVLDEMVYDLDSEVGSAFFSLLYGGVTFVSGQIAKLDPDAMTVQTPTATIGIRGTKFFMTQTGKQLALVNLPEETLQGQTVGEVLVYDHSGVLLNSIDKYGLGLKWDPGIQIVPATQQMTEAYVINVLAHGRRALPRTNDEMALDALEASEKASRKAEILAERAETLERKAAAMAEQGEDAATAGASRAAAKAALQAQRAAEKAEAAAQEAARALEAAENDMGFKANEHMLSDEEPADILDKESLLFDRPVDQGTPTGFEADRLTGMENAHLRSFADPMGPDVIRDTETGINETRSHSTLFLFASPRPNTDQWRGVEDNPAATESYSISSGFAEGVLMGADDKSDMIG